jgi:hypothetical protein
MEMASHEGFHALSCIRRRHLYHHDPEACDQIAFDEIMSRITQGEAMPKLVASFTHTVPPSLKPKYDLDEEETEVFETWQTPVFKILLKDPDCIDKQKFCLSASGQEKLIALMTPEIRSILEKKATPMTPEHAVIDVLNYMLAIAKVAKPLLVDKPYFPQNFRQPLADCMKDILSHPETYIDRPSWEFRKMNERGQNKIKALLNLPGANDFADQFKNKEDAEITLLNYARSIYYRFHILKTTLKSPLPKEKESILSQLPLTEATRLKAIEATRGSMSTIEGNLMVSLSNFVTNPEYQLAYAVMAFEERKAREESYQFHLTEVTRKLHALANGSLQDSGRLATIKALKKKHVELTANLTVMKHLDQFVLLMRRLDSAEHDMNMFKQIHLLETEQSHLVAQKKHLEAEQHALEIGYLRDEDKQTVSTRVLSSEETLLVPKVVRLQDRLAALQAKIDTLKQPQNILLKTPENEALLQAYHSKLREIKALYPDCTSELQNDIHCVKQIASY